MQVGYDCVVDAREKRIFVGPPISRVLSFWKMRKSPVLTLLFGHTEPEPLRFSRARVTEKLLAYRSKLIMLVGGDEQSPH